MPYDSAIVPANEHCQGTQGTLAWHDSPAPRKPCCRLSAFWTTVLLTVTVALVSAGPLTLLSVVNGRQMGQELLITAARTQFTVFYRATTTALDEADQWMTYIGSCLQATTIPLQSGLMEQALKDWMLPWIRGNARSIGGFCVLFPGEYGLGRWALCASREDWHGNRTVYWEWTNGSTMYKTRVDTHGTLLDTVSSWSTVPNRNEKKFGWPHMYLEWDMPWVWTEGRPDGSKLTFIEVGQTRMVHVGGVPTLHRLWMQETDWSYLIADAIQQAHSETRKALTGTPEAPFAPLNFSAGDVAVAFLFSSEGMLIATTCGQQQQDRKLIHVSNSSCALVRQTYQYLQESGSLAKGWSFGEGMVGDEAHLVGLRRIVTSRGDTTPYFLALSYSLNSVNAPIRNTVFLILAASAVLLPLVSLMLSLLAHWLIALPLRMLSQDMQRCVALELTSPNAAPVLRITEMFSIWESYSTMKKTFATVTKFVPRQVVRMSLLEGRPMRACMTPTSASVFFVDIAGFTKLMETTDTTVLVETLAAFFERLSNLVVARQGVIDKYIGDCVMAFWNTPEPVRDHETLACMAAIECRDAMEQDVMPVRLQGRIGLESGPVHAGLFGSSYRLNYTVVGDVVNVASRLEGLNKEFGTTILIGPSLYEKVEKRVLVKTLPPVDVKGKAEKMLVHEPISVTGVLHRSSTYSCPRRSPKGSLPIDSSSGLTLLSDV